MIARFHIALRLGRRGRLIARVTGKARPGERLVPITLHVPDALFRVRAREVVITMPEIAQLSGEAGAPLPEAKQPEFPA